MCVLVIKPAGSHLPTKRELQSMYRHNPDGCGFVSESDHYKSLDFDDFYQRLRAVSSDENCIIHFRLATHGKVSVQNCHPFYDPKSNTWFAHNGILPVVPMRGRTDSETAFKRLFAPAIQRHGLYSQQLATVAFNIIGGSKFAFMQDGMLRTFGHFTEYGGCFYSNLRHLNVSFRHAL